jgi:ADP-heptose:LPS heptosyltransferase
VGFATTRGGYDAANYARIAGALTKRLGAACFQLAGPAAALPQLPAELAPAARAAVAATAALVIGDDGGWLHAAAAAGAAVVALHGNTDPRLSSPRGEHVAALWQGCRVPGRHRLVHPTSPCFACLDPHRIVERAEELAVARYPWDRLELWR